MRRVAGRMKLELAQFPLAGGVRAVRLGTWTRPRGATQLERGLRLQEILKQQQFSPVPLEKQVAIIWAATNGHLDDIPVGEVGRFEAEFNRFLDASYPQVMEAIAKDKVISDESTAGLQAAVAAFKKTASF